YTSILTIGIEDEIVERGKVFLDTLSRLYIDYTVQSEFAINENTMNYIDKQIGDVKEIITQIEEDLETYKARKSILDLSREEEQYFSRLIDFDAQKRALQLQLNSISDLNNYLLNSDNSKLLPPSLYILDNDEFLRTALNELYNFQMERNKLLLNSTEK